MIARPNVLVSEPQGIADELQFHNSKPYLPYMWAVLKSFHERNSPATTVSWLDPIWLSGLPEAVLEPYEGVRIDVLGLSCYTWNWELQCAIAALVKERNPSCLVVAGGPEPDYKDRAFFADHPYIDVVVVKDGEIPFSRLLEHVVAGVDDFGDIGGLYLPGGSAHRYTGPAEVPAVFDHSPYLDQDEYYRRLTAGLEPGHFDGLLETNRGCPYGCSYCDWGSATNSKVRRFDMERIEAEIEWLASMRIHGLLIVDANFGILPRDVEIADRLNEIRERHGNYPEFIFWSAAKNNPDRVIAIAKKFARSGVCTSHSLSIQHTHPEVLAATDRSNISSAKQLQVVRAMMECDTPIEVQLILGIPGDTYERWKGCLADLMEWGIHEDYLIQAYRLLPNAPAAEPDFLRRWRINTVDRIMHDPTLRALNAVDSDIPQQPERLIVGTSSYSREDWVRMSTYSAMVKALHNASLTQRIAVYLRLTHGVGYQQFYEGLVEHDGPRLAALRGWRAEVEEHYRRFLDDADASDHMRMAELPELPWALYPPKWVFVRACLAAERFYAELTTYLLETYPQAANLESVIRYQHDVLILPSYDRNAGKRIRTDFDWPGYFARAAGREGGESLPEPDEMPGATIAASDRVAGERVNLAYYGQANKPFYQSELDWAECEQNPWVRWIENIVLGRSSTGMHNLKELRVETRV